MAEIEKGASILTKLGTDNKSALALSESNQSIRRAKDIDKM